MAEFVKTVGQNCKAAGFDDIYDLEECRFARDALKFPAHSSAIKDYGELANRPHGCTVKHDGLIRLYPKGTQACATEGQAYCLCKKKGTGHPPAPVPPSLPVLRPCLHSFHHMCTSHPCQHDGP